MAKELITGLGSITIRAIGESDSRPKSFSVYEDWGDFAPEAANLQILRWVIELTNLDEPIVAVGDLSAHATWYGPTRGSRAMNIGISLVECYRGLGIGTTAQRLLAKELHTQGVIRVEAGSDVTNIAEQRALENAGFAYEGTLKKAQARADGLHDLQVWAHIEAE
jgi:RimJ/RimL family protein N-acetyltransferase